MNNIDMQSISSNDETVSTHNTVEIPDTWLDLMTDEEIEVLEDEVLETIEEYVYGNIPKMSDPKFSSFICDDLNAYYFGLWSDAEICMDTDEDYIEVGRFIRHIYQKYMDIYSILPHRQCAIDTPVIKIDVSASLDRIYNIPQPKQRTSEWYERRYGMLTASNICKALGTEAQRNSLIYEKCKPFASEQLSCNVNVDNPMHWGVKYEPVSVAIYEHMYSLKLSEFGCIPHEKYTFIGASPDGIVTDPNHSRYGHMVEIKNIVNRDITGIPKEEYWIQMQVQLETCNLEYCDFLETRIKEYENAEQYYGDQDRQYRGIVLYFVKKMLVAGALPLTGTEDGRSNTPHYEYMPLDIPITQTSEWIKNKKAELQEEYVLYKTNYWYLDTISCVLVQRNREWFNAVVPQFISIWETIEKERVSGYTHRAPTKKLKHFGLVSQNVDDTRGQVVQGKGICLIKLDEAGNNIDTQCNLDTS